MLPQSQALSLTFSLWQQPLAACHLKACSCVLPVCVYFTAITVIAAPCLLQHKVAGLQQPPQAAQVAPHYSTWQLLQQLLCPLLPPTSHPLAPLAPQDHPLLQTPTTPAWTQAQAPTMTPAQTPLAPMGSQPCPWLSLS